MLSCNAMGGDGVGALMSVAGMPEGTLRFQLDGFWFDDAHNEWAYDMKTQRWLKTIVSVVSKPSQSEYYPYYVAYDYITGMAPFFYAFALPLPEAGLVPSQTLAEHFGLRGALYITDRLTGPVFEKLVASVGRDNMLRMTDIEVNSQMALLRYDKPPFLIGMQAAEFTISDSMLSGEVAGSKLVRVGTSDEYLTTGNWMTTWDQITDADGSLMSAEEIADRLALPHVPTRYAFVTKLSPGSTFLVGIANDMKVYGWGSGGAVQYFLKKGTFEISKPVSLPK